MSADPNNQPLSARPHILVIDDDSRIRELVSRYLKENGFVVVAAQDAADARAVMKGFEFDALVVDVMMPGETGLEFTKALRRERDIPVLLLTALGEVDDRVNGFDAGADDYLPKPFEPRELVARLNAILRRAPRKPEGRPVKIGNWHFDPAHDELTHGDTILRLTSVEANLLRALASSPGEVMSREKLAAICGLDSGERTIDVQVTRLRRKIEEDTKAPRYLQTVRGKGYLLRSEEI